MTADRLPSDAPPLVLAVDGVTKRFGPLVANDAVSLELRRGEVLALLGENGAGKTTLMNILFGHYVADEGSVRVAGSDGRLRVLEPGAPAAALAAGIGMVHQHFALAESLTVLENVVLGTRPILSPRLGLSAARRKLAGLIAESGLAVDPDERVSRLTVGEKQRVEILKVLYRDARILVLDEPTAVLTPAEAEGLFVIVRRLTALGIAVVFISHKLGEVLAIADRVAVLRGGRKVADAPAAGADRRSLAAAMVGREIAPSRRTPKAPGAPLLVLDKVSVRGERGRAGLVAADLTVRAGEIVGLAGVAGNGQDALAGLIAGLLRPASGRATLDGRALPRSPQGAVRAGIARIPEDRQHDGFVGTLTVAENLALETLDDPSVSRAGFLRFGRMRERAVAAIRDYDIRCPGPDAPVRLLSGGNAQKVILARVLDREPRLVLANQPTRGLDVGAATEIARRLLAAREGGAGILLLSDDLDELFALSDRIAVIQAGRLSAAMPTETLTLEQLGLLMAGQAGQVAA